MAHIEYQAQSAPVGNYTSEFISELIKSDWRAANWALIHEFAAYLLARAPLNQTITVEADVYSPISHTFRDVQGHPVQDGQLIQIDLTRLDYNGTDWFHMQPRVPTLVQDSSSGFGLKDIGGILLAPMTGGASLAFASNPVEKAVGGVAIAGGAVIAASVGGSALVQSLGLTGAPAALTSSLVGKATTALPSLLESSGSSVASSTRQLSATPTANGPGIGPLLKTPDPQNIPKTPGLFDLQGSLNLSPTVLLLIGMGGGLLVVLATRKAVA